MAFTPQGVPTQGLGFAIPAEVVRQTVDEFKKVADKQGTPATPAGDESATGDSTRADDLFGLQLQDLTNDLADALGYARGKGVLVSAVEPGSPADGAGFERGLVIYRLGKYDVNSVKDVERLLAKADTGSKVDFAVGIISRSLRGRRIETVNLEAR
jgi:S1-C subfamily serine protease